jgi:hypothetical protein
MEKVLALLLVMAACGCSGEPGGDGKADGPSNSGPRRAPAAGEQASPAEPEYPPAVRQPTRSEAERIAASCGTRARPATMQGGLLRLAAWAAYEPIDATPAQARCFYDRIRLLVAQGTVTR